MAKVLPVKAGDKVFLLEHKDYVGKPHDLLGEVVGVDHTGKEALVRWGTGVLDHHQTRTLKVFRN